MIALAPMALSFAAPSSDLPTIWPAPSTSSFGTGVRTVVPSKAFFRLSTGSSPLLEAAFERYAGLTFPHAADAPSLDTAASALGCEVPSAASAAITYMHIEVADLAEDHPRLETDESYTLSISDDGAEPAVRGSAQTVYGALRLLETFSQLVAFDFDCGRYEVGGAPWLTLALALTLALPLPLPLPLPLTLTLTRWAARRGGSPTRPASRTAG